MEHQSYYRIPDGSANNQEDLSQPLTVNCAGLTKSNHPYQTHMPRGRKDYYLQYCVEGTIAVSEGGKTHSIAPGQLLILSPKTPYICKNTTPNVTYYWIHFTGADAEGLLTRCGFECNKIYTAGNGERLPRLFRALFREYLWRDRCFEDSSQACLISILTELSRMRDTNEKNSPTVNTIFLSLSYFHNHINAQISVADLAEMEHFSPSRYRTVFRQCTGMSPSEYMTRMRMRRACELLAMENISIREVAESCGYPDQLYFSRVFRSYFGISPSKYKTSEEEFNEI